VVDPSRLVAGAKGVYGETAFLELYGEIEGVPEDRVRIMADGEELVLGSSKRVRWLDAPHLPHNWECGYMFESSTRTLLCGDLFTHGGDKLPALTETEVLSPAEAMRLAMPASVAIDVGARKIIDKLAATEPRTLALMHGSSYRGDGGKLLRAFGDALGV